MRIFTFPGQTKMDMDNTIKWATELIEEKLKLEDEKQQVSIESQIRLVLGTQAVNEDTKDGTWKLTGILNYGWKMLA